MSNKDCLHTVYKVYIKVFITKSNKFRAQVCEILHGGGKNQYEVTIGGKEWLKGKGSKYKTDIKLRMIRIISNLDEQCNDLKI